MQAGGWSDFKVVGAEGTSSLSCVEVRVAFSACNADGVVTESPQTSGMSSNIPSLTVLWTAAAAADMARGLVAAASSIGGGKRVAEKMPWVWEAAFIARVLKVGN